MKLKLNRSPYRSMLDEDSQFKLWVENLERGSPITVHEHFRRMGRMCKDLNVTPRELALLGYGLVGAVLPTSRWRSLEHSLALITASSCGR